MTMIPGWGPISVEGWLARWRFLEPDEGVVGDLAREAEVDPLCARVLANRGVPPGGASAFLAPSLKAIGTPEEDPWGVGARRVAKAIEAGERIGVFGDYDTDGLTSAAVLYLALSNYTRNLTVALPTRQKGYSLREPYVRDLFAEGVDLLITADCGISNRRTRRTRPSPSSTRSCGTPTTRSPGSAWPGSSPGPSPASSGTRRARRGSGACSTSSP